MMSNNGEAAPADERRPQRDEGVIAHLWYYAWAIAQYLMVFSVGTIGLIAAIAVVGAMKPILVGEYLTEPQYGMATGVWLFASLGIILLWCKTQMAKTGIED